MGQPGIVNLVQQQQIGDSLFHLPVLHTQIDDEESTPSNAQKLQLIHRAQPNPTTSTNQDTIGSDTHNPLSKPFRFRHVHPQPYRRFRTTNSRSIYQAKRHELDEQFKCRTVRNEQKRTSKKGYSTRRINYQCHSDIYSRGRGGSTEKMACMVSRLERQ
ncbi:hypothetical protein L218DRAFT_951049 [Marasmius fiardii PR-910]|nr:hypothetical protein L218DRAFT_951049 [Marasmius fiardii PR-910]